MWCFRARRLISTDLDGELEPRRREALEAHLGRCARCRAELAACRESREALSRAGPVPAVPPDLWGRIVASLDEAQRQPWHRRRRAVLLRAAAVTGAVLLGLAGGALLTWQGPHPGGGRAQDPALESALVAEAFGDSLLGLAGGKEGLLRCVPR